MTPAAAIALLLLIGGVSAQVRYFGKEVGALAQLQHGVRGHVYAVDSRTLYLKDFYYDGEGPAAYFYVGSTGSPSAGITGATRLRDERGGGGPLRKYRGESITLTLPDGKTLRDYKWFAVYCDEYSVNFGDVSIPRGMEYPRPAKVAPLRGVHGVSSDPIVVVDAQTLLVPNFSYDGEAPDAKFWVGRGDKPSPQGIRIPDENGKESPLRKYDKKTIVLTLPGELTVFDIGHFAVWCEAFTVNFGHVTLPRASLANVPPSLKMLGVSPQSKLNCEVLYDELAFEVRWAVAGDSIVLQLVAKLEDGEYMAFGPSGDNAHTQMVGGDPVVAWVDKQTLKGHAIDYYLDAKSQCAGVRGSCPDERLVEETNSIRPLNAALVNGYSIVTYQRPLRAADELDRAVLTNTSQAIIWAIGPLNSRNEVSYHPHFTKSDKLIEFGRPPVWNCPMPEDDESGPPPLSSPAHNSTHQQQHHPIRHIKPNPVPAPSPVPKVAAWEIPAIQCYEPPDGVFYAQMGPTGGKQGYSAITGHVGWGISWYINGLLIPEINVVRGRKYTFVVEGGSDPDVPARYHPFYITNDHIGGYYHKTDQEKEGVEIYAGVRRTRTGELVPTGVGRLCNWTPDKDEPDADEYPSFGAYQRSLTLVCEEGSPGVVTWIPDNKTPDTVYYQCFTHRHLGWKINVLDECDESEGEESRVEERVVQPDDLVNEESVQVQTRLSPAPNVLDDRKKYEKIINTKTNYDNFSSYKGDDILTGEMYPNKEPYNKDAGEYSELPISTVQIKNVIQTVENMENKAKVEMKRNMTHPQYQVHEDVKELFAFEHPMRDDEEYLVEPGKISDFYLLPANPKPLTLQSVLRPNSNKPMVNMRPPFRRLAPPEIKIRRPHPMYQKVNMGYPLSLPNVHGLQGIVKKFPPKYTNRSPLNMNRPQMPGMPPMKNIPPVHQNKPNFNQQPSKQINKTPNSPVQSIIIGKPGPNSLKVPTPNQNLNLGQTDIIANQVVKSQIVLPGGNDAIAQHSNIQTYLNKPGQIILGKPMDNPVPLDQQMIPTKQLGMRSPPTTPPSYYQSTPSIILQQENKEESQNEIIGSDFIGESAEKTTIPPAVNTGFKPDSIVVESGFKPIIREPLMASVDKIAEYKGYANRREDADVEEDYEEEPQLILNKKHRYPSDAITETFEPIFIPSPPDHLSTNDRTKEVFPSNHAREDRPHPVYVDSDTQENERQKQGNALFSKQNMEKELLSDLIMESDRISPHYLPPDPKLPKEHSQKLSASNDQTFTTYDGKTVSAATLTKVPEDNKPNTKLFSAKLPANSEQLLRTPQFGPFRGEIPPPVAAHINKDSQDLPSAVHNTRTTRLKLINLKKSGDSKVSDLKAESSDKIEFTENESEPDDEDLEEYEEYDGDNDDDDMTRTRYETVDTDLLEMGEIEESRNDKPKLPRETKDTQSQTITGNTAENKNFKSRTRRETKDTQFEMGEIEEIQTNGHSMPKNQVDFETEQHVTATASSVRLYWLTHIVLLTICMKIL